MGQIIRIRSRSPYQFPPVAAPDAYSTAENTPLVVPVPGVLSNDTDPNGDPLVAILDSGVSHGLLALDPNGSFVYTPTLSYIGTDSFTYRANDGIDNSNLAVVSLTITGTNTSPIALDDSREYLKITLSPSMCWQMIVMLMAIP